jgi:phosphopantothenoylcysteine decarboxylase/phosphopantothenate--cysteine ligase
MRPFDGKRVLVGVSGGIAAYKSAELVRRLIQAGCEVKVILTDNGARFVGPATFEGLTGKPVLQSLWEGALQHIELGRWADAIVVAPATANLLARLAAGLADDLLTTTLLAAPRRALLAPAMNTRMYEHPATRQNLERLREFGTRSSVPRSANWRSARRAGAGWSSLMFYSPTSGGSSSQTAAGAARELW